MKVPRFLRSNHVAVLDTNLLIYLFEDHPQFGPTAEFIIDQIASGRFKGVITPITLAEMLVKPLKENRPDITDNYRSALRHLVNVDVIDIDVSIGEMAGALRAQYGLPLPDMMQVACALKYDHPTLITQDKRMAQVEEVRVVMLKDFQ